MLKLLVRFQSARLRSQCSFDVGLRIAVMAKTDSGNTMTLYTQFLDNIALCGQTHTVRRADSSTLCMWALWKSARNSNMRILGLGERN